MHQKQPPANVATATRGPAIDFGGGVGVWADAAPAASASASAAQRSNDDRGHGHAPCGSNFSATPLLQ